MGIHNLTKTDVERLLRAWRAGKERITLDGRQVKTIGKHGDGANLYLQITRRGPSWVVRYKLPGRSERWHGIGGATERFGLDEARERARECRKLLADGIDPIGEAEAKRHNKARTFAVCFTEFFGSHKVKLKNLKQRKNYESSVLRYAVPVIGNIPIDQITDAHVLSVVEPLWLTKTQTMRRVRERIEAVLGWATRKGYRKGDNPARWELLKDVLPSPKDVKAVTHHKSVGFREMPGFMRQLRQAQGPDSIDLLALEFVILTGCSTGDIIGQKREARPPFKWTDVDDRGAWRIPACDAVEKVTKRKLWN